MNGKEFELIRTELGLNQTQLGEMLEKGKDTICRIEAKKQVPVLYALAIVQLKQNRVNKMNAIKNAVEKQANDIKKIIEQVDGLYSIKITDHVCALDFEKYAINGKASWNDAGTEFTVDFDDAKNVNVSLEDFIKYQMQYNDDAIALEEEFADDINDLRDAQSDFLDELLALFAVAE